MQVARVWSAGRREAGGSRRPLSRQPNKRGLAESPGAVGAVIDSISDVSIMTACSIGDLVRGNHTLPIDQSTRPVPPHCGAGGPPPAMSQVACY